MLLRFANEVGCNVDQAFKRGRAGYCIANAKLNTLVTDVLAKSYPISSMVIVMIGTNDLRYANFNVEEWKTLFTILIETLIRDYNVKSIIVCTLIPLAVYNSSLMHWKNLEAVNKFVESLQKYEQVFIFDSYRYFIIATPGNEKSAEYVKNNEIVQQARTDLYCPRIGKTGRTDLVHWSAKGINKFKNALATFIEEKFHHQGIPKRKKKVFDESESEENAGACLYLDDPDDLIEDVLNPYLAEEAEISQEKVICEVPLEIGNFREHLFVDCGSDYSIIPEETLLRIIQVNPELKFERIKMAKKTLKVAKGRGRVVLDECILLTLRIGEGTTKKWVAITKELNCSFILGKDLLKRMNAKIDFENEALEWKDDRGKIITTKFISRYNEESLGLQLITEGLVAGLEETPECIKELNLEVSFRKKDDLYHHLSDGELRKLVQTILPFVCESNKIGRCNKYTHSFIVKPGIDIRRKSYPIPKSKEKEVDDEVDTWLEWGIVEDSSSPYVSPLVIVTKSNGKVRPCGDFQEINRFIIPHREQVYPIEIIMMQFGGSMFFTIVDLTCGFLQIPLHPDSRPYVAFIYKGRVLQFTRLPFGSIDSMQAFINAMIRVLGEMIGTFVVVYVDDILIFSLTFEDHLKHIHEVLKRIHEAGMTINLNKSKFAQTSVKFLGYELNSAGYRPDPEKVQAIINFTQPSTTKQIQQFLGILNFYRKHIDKYSEISIPLINLTKDDQKFKWSQDEENAFDNLKNKLAEKTLLSHPNWNDIFYIETDASDKAIAAHIYQLNTENEPQPLGFVSRVLKKHEKNYATFEKELMAIIYVLRKFTYMLYGYPIVIKTDSESIVEMKNNDWLSKKVNRWLTYMKQFNYRIEHIRGRDNSVADALSRNVDGMYVRDEDEMVGRCISIPVTLSHSLKNIASLQKADIELSEILNSNKTPDAYLVLNNTLYRCDKEGNRKLVVPHELKCELIWFYHEYLGHCGIEKTALAIKQRFTWRGLYEDVRNELNICQDCNTNKIVNRSYEGPLHPIISNRPLELVAVDIYGPLPPSQAHVQYIFVVLDTFTKYVRLYAVKETHAKILTTKMKNFINDCGPIQSILSDKGSQFMSRHWKKFWQARNTYVINTSRYTPTSNPAERVMRSLGDFFRIHCHEKHSSWLRKISILERRLNFSVHASTKKLPFWLMKKRMPDDPLQKLVPISMPFNEEKEYAEASDNLLHAAQLRIKRHDENTKLTILKPGDWVYVKQHTLSDKARGIAKKFAPLRCGPYVVKEVVTPNAYKLTDPISGEDLPVENIRNLYVTKNPEIDLHDT